MKVVFRAWKGSGELFALFPEWAGGPRGLTCVSLDRNGHSAADYARCILGSRPAKPGEIEKAMEFMAPRGYLREEVQPISRVHPAIHRARQEAVRWD